ncbi:MAG: PAS domain-containing protein, partial [Pseudomonadota bacterium]
MPSANPAPSQDVEGVNTAPDAAPRPPTPDEIVAMMDAAVQQKTNEEDTEEIEGKRRDGIGVSLILFWFGIGATIAAVGYIVFASGESGVSSLALAGALAFLVALFVAGAAIKTVSPSLIAGAMMRRAAGAGPVRSAKLAGAEILNALGLAEPVIEADPDATLITRRDGVVSYANDAYFTLAADAGVMGAAGLPPRIDRLFAQQGTEATKVFRLCRAAKSGVAAEETVSQLMGVSGGGRRRRFVLSVAPIESAPEFVVWRLRELPEEEEQQDILASAYADFPRPVFALERSGQILWANAAMRTRLNADRNGLRRLEDVALGDTDDLARSLWRVDQTPQSAVFRRANQEPVEAQLTAFRRGGLGEGFVCVDAALDDEEPEVDNDALSGDMSESPFGVAVVEGEVNRDGRIVEANKAFAEVFGAAGKNTPLAKVLPPAALEELSTEIKRKSRGGPAPVEATLGTGSQARSYALYPRPVRRRRGAYGSRRLFLYSVDITDRKRMEVDVAQDQKLRGIGELASKVAHDFNNYLQVVLGHCERLMLKHPAGDPAYGDLVQIRENAQRAANTTKQLLAFSRKQTLTREVLSITEILRDFSRFLTRAIGEKVTLELVNGRGLPPVKVDRYQLESAIMNLAVNARDAMGADGGAFTIRTRLITAEEALGLSVPGLKEQDYVLIEAADTGPGVPPEIVDKVFDPFFTTK